MRRFLSVLLPLVAVGTAAPAIADTPAPHQITYTVTAETAVTADIYYRDVDPPTWADYSHNPYVFSPRVRVDVGPDRPWVLHTTLLDPDRWAMVSATSGQQPTEPRFRCELSVDGVVVSTADGPKGALCALRHW
ncbi:hypothetical protein [Mycobacterium sp. ACS4331]|uniref:hypothetical protein n=1 Tax=Mycobacterium sp. ACS4331 TaxID=1834121 RepID=UPI0007FC52A7|nr:hypothetical protein [Mycobacterium sp. ACS4331]OBF13663.1 hypothetical protein A5727_16490 [Mycobacterium sp. ACS4331]